jgi:hypothetical protein
MLIPFLLIIWLNQTNQMNQTDYIREEDGPFGHPESWSIASARFHTLMERQVRYQATLGA